jgi:probable HAF family extracellular repeat protein/autotransporter-associated beta strand protein
VSGLGITQPSFASAVSSDGSFIVGQSTDNPFNVGEAFRWSGGVKTDLGFLSTSNRGSTATGVSSSGGVVVGISLASTGNTQAFKWSNGTMTGLGDVPSGIGFSVATGVSGDGTVVVGRSSLLVGPIQAVKWVRNSQIGLGFLDPSNPNRESSALAISGDATTIVGVSKNAADLFEATLWANNTITGLGYLNSTAVNRASEAFAVSQDGSVVVGSSTGAGGLDAAFRWTAALGMQSIQAILVAGGFSVAGFDLSQATGLSGNGSTIVGNGWIANIPVNAFALLDLAGTNHALPSLVWGGVVTNSSATPATLTIGSDNSNSTFSGTIQDGTGAVALTKIGSGAQTLSGSGTYSGPTFVDAGTLQAGAAMVFSPNSSYLVAAGSALDLQGFDQIVGGLAGPGAVINSKGALPTLTIASGGSFAPGDGTPGSSMTVTANLAFQSGALYLVQVNSATSSFANVVGNAALNGATVKALFANGASVAKQYTILTAGSVSGAFGAVNTNLPSGFKTDLSYDATHAYLDLALNFAPPSGQLNVNQQNVGNAIINFFNSNGSIPIVFGALTPAGLTQLSGESATASQQTTFDAMSQFMSLLTDPSTGRGNGINGAASATGYAEEGDQASAYAASKRLAAERDAYAVFTKAPLAKSYQPRWSVWASGFGGSQTTNGNATVGSNDTRSGIFGTAVGADYLLSPRTIAGFALAGGGTNFSVNNLGSGRSDLFQAGAFVRHNIGPAYITGALAYGWQDITADRIVTVAGLDHLRAQFNANAWSGRVEGGYRFVAPVVGGIGITPYAAAQFVTFDLPAYMEQAIVGNNTFALGYNAKSVTDGRSELGVRTDKSFAAQGGIFTLRGRLAWAHDFDPDRNLLETFQSLPGASFVVNGATHTADSALTAASAEWKWIDGWSAAATFEGEFSNVTSSYAGKGVVRYIW